jgi:hypothetical protein
VDREEVFDQVIVVPGGQSIHSPWRIALHLPCCINQELPRPWSRELGEVAFVE